jgi:hypothetical protein
MRGFYERRAYALAYELADAQAFKYEAEWLLKEWLEEREAGFTHAGKVEFLASYSESLLTKGPSHWGVGLADKLAQ